MRSNMSADELADAGRGCDIGSGAGLEFEDDAERTRCSELASEAIRLINLIAPEEDKLKAQRKATHQDNSKCSWEEEGRIRQGN